MNERNDTTGTHTVSSASDAPMTWKQRVGGIAFAVMLIGVGVLMLLRPELELGDPSSMRRGGMLVRVFDFIWSQPAGVVVGLLGVLVFVGSVRSPSAASPVKSA